jgi:hypothetical protein
MRIDFAPASKAIRRTCATKVVIDTTDVLNNELGRYGFSRNSNGNGNGNGIHRMSSYTVLGSPCGPSKFVISIFISRAVVVMYSSTIASFFLS